MLLALYSVIFLSALLHRGHRPTGLQPRLHPVILLNSGSVETLMTQFFAGFYFILARKGEMNGSQWKLFHWKNRSLLQYKTKIYYATNFNIQWTMAMLFCSLVLLILRELVLLSDVKHIFLCSYYVLATMTLFY